MLNIRPRPVSSPGINAPFFRLGARVDVAAVAAQSDGVWPMEEAFTNLVAQHGATFDLAGAVSAMEGLVAAGHTPSTTTVAALAGAAQRAGAYELVFAIAAAARARGLPPTRMLAFQLVRACFDRLRFMGWGREAATSAVAAAATRGVNRESRSIRSWPLITGAQVGVLGPASAAAAAAAAAANVADAVAAAGDGSAAMRALSERALHALTGRGGLGVSGDGPKDACAWRDRADGVYRCV